MRTWIVILVLAMSCSALAQGFGSAQAAAPAKKVEIKDPAEFTAYDNASKEPSDAAKAAAFEGFLTQYPNSVVKVSVLEQLMGAYEKTGNVPKLKETANRLLDVDQNSLRALALIAYLDRQTATSGKPEDMQKTLAEAVKYAERGLQAEQAATKPDGVSDADFQKLKTETSAIFNGVIGFAALQNKDFGSAQSHLQDAVNANPTNLADLYPLAIAYLAGWPSPQAATPPPTAAQGIWYLARAAAISPDATQKAGILKYGHSLYTKYHGDDLAYPAWAPNTNYTAGALVVGGGKVEGGNVAGGKAVVPAFPGASSAAAPKENETYIEKCTTAGKSGATVPTWCGALHCSTQDGPVAWSNEGNNLTWDAITLQAAKGTKPSANFAIKSRPTPAEEAAKMAEKSVKEMGFDEFQFIFSNGSQEVVDKIWEQIKDKPIGFEAKVIDATATKLRLAASAEDIEKKPSSVADVEVTMVVPLTAKNKPAAGATVQLQGTPVSYTAKPFMITMTKGVLLK
ncbi:MAG: hypothetical protein ABSD20_20985 [Terriglobales bacterium]|jgi:tetratricopeptide (TPR) repeat protein